MIKLLPKLFAKPADRSFISVLKTISFSLLFIFGFGANAQVSSYGTTDSATTPAYTGITGIALFGTNWLDVVSPAINIGFTFNFNGKDYTQCYISSNGFITFGAAPSTTNYNPISDTTDAYEGAIAVYGRDLKNNGLPVVYLSTGTAPNRTFTVQYNVLRAAGTFNAGTYNMQIILHESAAGNVTNRGYVELRYGPHSTPANSNNTLNGEVGLRGETNVDFNNKKYITGSAAWPSTSPVMPRGTSNVDAVATRTSTPSISQSYNFEYRPPTCPAPIKVKVTPGSITQSGATATWTAPVPAPASCYEYQVSTTPPTNINVVDPVAPIVATGTSVGTSAAITGLSAGTTYYVYVRSICGPAGGFSSAAVFTTLCTSYTVNPPYVVDFNAVVTPSIPNCTVIQTTQPIAGQGGFWYSRVASTPDWGFPTKHLRVTAKPTGVNGSSFFTQGIYMVTTKSYRISYKYGASAEVPISSQRLTVGIGTSPVVVAMTATLGSHIDFKGGPYTNVENFIPPADGVYYIGFTDTTPATNATTLLDDIDIRESTCLTPTGLISGLVTETSAAIAWIAPASTPSDGYGYYLSFNPTAPTSATPATGTVSGLTANLSNLLPGTTYYFWVRSNCGNGDMSSWASTYGTFTTLISTPLPAASCTPTSSSNQTWITKFSTTGALANISNASVYALPNGYGDYTSQAVTQFQAQTVNFTVLTNAIPGNTVSNVGVAIWVDWDHNGVFATTERVFNTTGYVANATGTITVPSGALVGSARMRVLIDYISSNPSNPCAISATRGEIEDYRFNVLLKPPAITLSASTAITCSGVQTPAIPAPPVTITSGASNYNAFFWTPAPTVTGNEIVGYRFTPLSTTEYTLTALNTTTFETTSVKFKVTVNQPPTSIVVNAAPTATVCEQGPAIALNATGGFVSETEIFAEDFNGEAPGWQTINSSVGSAFNVQEVGWYLQPDNYNSTRSNDRTQFAYTDSDAGGSSTITRTGLISPAINLSGATVASLSFWQFYNTYFVDLIPESARVQWSTSDSGPWADLVVYPGSNDVGNYTNFVNSTVDLAPALGNPLIYLQFYYEAQWDFSWAIDNVVVSGNSSTAISWTPNGIGSGLFTDAAATLVYNGGPANTVYAFPSANQVYTASASSGLGCQTATPVSVTLTPFKLGNTTPANQTTCSGELSSDIVLSGNTLGTLVRWEYSTNATFTPKTNLLVTTPTLTAAYIKTIFPIISSDVYFRPIFTGCSTKAGVAVKVSVAKTTYTGTWDNGMPDATKMAVFAGGNVTLGDLTACSILVQNGTIKIPADKTLTVSNGIVVNVGGTLEFLDDSSLLQSTTRQDVNTGNILYHRNSTDMVAYDYTYWGSPVAPQTVFNFSPLTRFDKYFTWDPASSAWQIIAAPGTTAMQPGVGYLIRAPSSYTTTPQAYDGKYTGVPNNGTYTVPVVVNGVNNLNFLSNPYPSAIDAQKLMDENPVSLGGGTTFYYWTHNSPIYQQGYSPSDFAMFNYTGTIPGDGDNPSVAGNGNNSAPTKYIAAGQGFMAVGIGNDNVTFNNTIRVSGTNNRNFYKSENSEIQKDRIWLDLYNENSYKQMLVGYIENATNNFENAFDAETMEAGNSINFYSVLDNKSLAIQGRSVPFATADLVPVGYRVGVACAYNIRLAIKEGLFTTQKVYLEDKLLQVTHDFGVGDYNFVSDIGTFNDRFVLRYTDDALGINQPIFDDNALKVYKDRNGINFKTIGFEMASIKIYDINGREILTRNDINSNTAVIANLSAAQQVLLLKITTTDGVVVHKKIVF